MSYFTVPTKITTVYDGGTGFGNWTDQAYRTIVLDEPATGDFLTWLEANAVKQGGGEPVINLVDRTALDNALTATADAIRAKTGGTEDLTFDMENETGFEDAIENSGLVKPSGKLNITDTTVKDVSTYAQAQIVDANLVAENIKKDVTILGRTGTYEGGGSPVLETKSLTVTKNGTQQVTPDAGFDGIGLLNLITNVAGGAGDLNEAIYQYFSGRDGIRVTRFAIQGNDDGNLAFTPDEGWTAIGIDEVRICMLFAKNQTSNEVYALIVKLVGNSEANSDAFFVNGGAPAGYQVKDCSTDSGDFIPMNIYTNEAEYGFDFAQELDALVGGEYVGVVICSVE